MSVIHHMMIAEVANRPPIPDYLCFTALEQGSFTLTVPAAVTSTNLSYVEYSLDGRNWTRLTVDSTDQTITTPTIAQGGKVYWRGSGNCMTATSITAGMQSVFSSTARFDVSGHIMSLLKGDNFASYTHLTNYSTDGIRNVTFARLFEGCSTIVNAKDLILPTFTSWFTYIFQYMFYNSSLVSAPNLPSLDTAPYCYGYMFNACTSLTQAPSSIAATTLRTQCCRSMFEGDTALVTAPSIAATTLDGGGELYRTFSGCTSLVTPPSDLLPTSINVASYYMTFNNCSSMTTMPTLHFTSIASDGVNACLNMFAGCSNLTGEVTIDVPSAPKSAFNGMFGSTRITKAYIRCSIAGEESFRQTFFNVQTLSDIDIIGATSVGVNAYLSCFYACRVTRQNIVLPATKLAEGCYKQMFYSSNYTINKVTCLATDISATDCLTNWLANAASTGTFIKAENITWPSGASGIPTGWVDIEKRTMPSGYKQVDSVTSDGTSYIQLGFGFEETDNVAATFSVDTSQTTDKYIVCPQTWDNNSNRFGMGVHGGGYYTGAFGNRSTGNTILTPRTSNDGELHNWTYAAATFTVTDKSCSINITSYTFGGITTNLRLFYGYNSNTKGAISSYKHIKGSTASCDIVACVRESDNAAGLYDLENDEFMTCSGLTAGQEI